MMRPTWKLKNRSGESATGDYPSLRKQNGLGHAGQTSGRRTRRRWKVCAALAVFGLFCAQPWWAPAQVTEDQAAHLRSLLPQVPGWRLAEDPEIYDRTNLFDYIDGNCELYYSYGFIALVSAMYENVDSTEQTLIVDVYDMGTPLGAFGVYSSSVYPTFEFAPIGCEAVVSELQVRFWQDRYEVELNGEVPLEVLVRFARATSRKLPDCQLPSELDWLPAEGQRPHTLRYVAEALLGQQFMPAGFEATYLVDSTEVRGFVARTPSADSAANCLQRLRDSYRKLGATEAAPIPDGFGLHHPYTGYVLAAAWQEWVFGAVCQESLDAAESVLLRIRAHLRKQAGSQ